MKDNKYITRDRKLEFYTIFYAVLMFCIIGMILIYPDDGEYVGVLTLTWLSFSIGFVVFREDYRHNNHIETISVICNILENHENKLEGIDRISTEILKALKEYKNDYVEVEIKDE